MAIALQKISHQLTRQIARVPGVVEGYVGLCGLAGTPPLYDSGWRRLYGWLQEAEGGNAPLDCAGKRFLLFALLPSHVDYTLALAVLLLARGASVDVAWLPHATYGSRIPPTTGYPFWRRSARGMGGHPHPRLRIIDLELLSPAEPTAELKEIAARQALVDTSYVVLKESVDVEKEGEEQTEYRFRLQRNLDALLRLAELSRHNSYDRAVLINGAILEFGVAYELFRSRGIPTSTYEIQNNGTLIVSQGATVMGMDASDLWQRDEPHLVTPERRRRVEELIARRERPAERVDLESLQLAAVVAGEQVRQELALEAGKPLVLICPNCPFDAAYFVEGKKHFATMVQWLQETLSFFASRSDCQVVVRCHPAERFYQAVESTADIVAAAFPELPPHFRVVKPQDPVSTYSLMRLADLGVVYWSTTGLEMALRGIPVISGVPCLHYNGKGFTLDPGTQEEYYGLMEEVLRDPVARRLSPRQVELAWCYADVFFNDWPKPFPWSLGRRFWHDLKEWPVRRILSPEGEERFGTTLRSLCGT